jgi:hypothetical protein
VGEVRCPTARRLSPRLQSELIGVIEERRQEIEDLWNDDFF